MIVIDSISVLLFGFTACTYTQFMLGIVAIYNFLKNLNNMEKISFCDLERWVGSSAGLFAAKSGLDMMKMVWMDSPITKGCESLAAHLN